MKKLRYIFVSLAALMLAVSCEQMVELEENAAVEEGKEVTIRISYGSNVDEVCVTKAGLTAAQESAIYSIYVMTFNQNGARTNNTTDALFYRTDTQTSERTWIDQSSEKNYSEGYIQFNAKTGANTTVYAVANVNTAELSGLYSLSSDDLDKVTTLDQLKALTVGLNTKAVSRGSQMMMMGVLKESETSTEPKKVTINSSTTVQEFSTLYFERLDAKVTFNVSVASGANAEFALHTWQVFNAPFNSNLVSTNTLGGGLDPDSGLQVFDTPTSNQFDNGKSFTFYMLENNLAPQTALTDYIQREMKDKGDNGAYEITDGSWTWMYAPKQSTYVQIKGRLSQTVTSNEGTDNEVTDLIHADVVYNVHLGDFRSSANNFWTKPNTEYTYNIYIAGVNNIRTEVETSNDDDEGETVTENQPGAEGNVVVASGGNIYEVDAHYAQILVPFEYSTSFIDAMGGTNSIDDLTWYVATPYSEGTYEKDANNSETNHYDKQYLDYKWAEFYINDTKQMVTYGEYLEWLRTKGRATLSGRVYTKTNPLYLDELVEELKAWYNYMSGASTNKPNLINAGTPGSTQTIYVTIFVNEFYYDNGNPLTNDGDIPAMVRKVVNTEDRYMHILSNVDYSADGASSVTNSAATIIQKPIRSIYNIPDFGLISGYNLIWGTETVSEKYGSEDGMLGGRIDNYQASSNMNGRLNSYYLWNGEEWSDIMTIENNIWTMKNADTQNENPAVFACLARNRDENGNGTIDVGEMRWYMAAISQLQYLYIGESVIHSDAKLMPSSITAEADDYANYYHYLSSTYMTNGGKILWAEEGLSVSHNYTNWDSDPKGKNYYPSRYVRCLRNLGNDGTTTSTIGNNMSTLTEVVYNDDGTITIYPTYLNKDALRKDKWTMETIPHDDRSSLNQMYNGGMIVSYDNVSKAQATTTETATDGMYYMLENQTTNCPDGWHVPTQRELALILMDSGLTLTKGYMITSSTYNWYKTAISGNYSYASAIGQDSGNNVITTVMTVTDGSGNVRCVRDVDAANTASSYNNGGSLTE